MANKIHKIDFIRGFCCAVADLVRSHDEPTLALSLLVDSGIRHKDVEMFVDEYDKKEIDKLWVI